MALPYGVKVLHEGWNYEWDQELSTLERVIGIDDKFIYTKVIDNNGEEYKTDRWPIELFEDKPYLRPMSSMTEEELNEFESIFDFPISAGYDSITGELCAYNHIIIDKGYCVEIDISDIADMINWFNSHHIDYCGLIEKGLAIAVIEEKNPYED